MSDEGAAAGGRATRRTSPVLALVVFAAFASLLPRVAPLDYDPTIGTGDGAVYLVCARNLLRGQGYSYLGEPFTIRPPGFSFLLAPALAVLGMDFDALALCMTAVGALALALLFAYQRPRLGTPAALAVTAAVGLNPGFLQATGEIMSDVPGLAALLACLLLERWARRAPSPRRDVVLGLAIGAAALVRTMNVLIAPALVASRVCAALRRPECRAGASWPRFALRRLALPAGVAALCLVPWSARNALVGSSEPVEDTLFHSYGTAMWRTDWADPASPLISAADLAARVEERTANLLNVLGGRLAEGANDPLGRAVAAALIACWAAVLAVRRGTGDFMAGAMMAVIAVYFGFMARLVLPVWALVLPAAAQVLLWLLARAVPRPAAGWLTAAALAGLAAHDFDAEAGRPDLHLRSRAFFEACEEVGSVLREDDVLAADFGAHFALGLDRRVYTLRWVVKKSGLPAAVDLMRRRGVSVVILDRVIGSDLELLETLKRAGCPVIARSGPWVAVRVRM